jgi:hypothetical protein
MHVKIYSAAVYGVDAYEVEIEVNGAGGDAHIIIVGLPDAAVKESRDRVTTAISNSGYYWPRGRTTINLASADIKKGPKSWSADCARGAANKPSSFRKRMRTRPRWKRCARISCGVTQSFKNGDSTRDQQRSGRGATLLILI